MTFCFFLGEGGLGGGRGAGAAEAFDLTRASSGCRDVYSPAFGCFESLR